MKTTKSMIIYFITFISAYFLISIFVSLFYQDYVICITDRTWLLIYSLFLGWWISMIPALEYSESNNNK